MLENWFGWTNGCRYSLHSILPWFHQIFQIVSYLCECIITALFFPLHLVFKSSSVNCTMPLISWYLVILKVLTWKMLIATIILPWVSQRKKNKVKTLYFVFFFSRKLFLPLWKSFSKICFKLISVIKRMIFRTLQKDSA